jgi:hypothetical protein
VALTLLGAVAVGLFCASLAFIAVRFLGRDRRFLIPVAGGAGMLGFTIWNDYDWIGRHRAGLPDAVEVVDTIAEPSPIKPWTLIAAPVVRYRALDRRTIEPTPEGARRATVYFVSRWAPTYAVALLFDCAGGRMAEAAAPDAWAEAEPGDPLFAAACRDG